MQCFEELCEELWRLRELVHLPLSRHGGEKTAIYQESWREREEEAQNIKRHVWKWKAAFVYWQEMQIHKFDDHFNTHCMRTSSQTQAFRKPPPDFD
jgi:hypothetical protein